MTARVPSPSRRDEGAGFVRFGERDVEHESWVELDVRAGEFDGGFGRRRAKTPAGWDGHSMVRIGDGGFDLDFEFQGP